MFDELFPLYLSYGMTYDQYWHGEPELVKAYEKANNLRYNRTELELWKSGVYHLHATAAVLDKNSKYPEKPLFLIEDERDELRKEIDEMKSEQQFWEHLMKENNKKYIKSNQESK